MRHLYLSPLAGVLLALAGSGCATQANLVDLEADVAALKQRVGTSASASTQVLTREIQPTLADTPPIGSPTELLDLAIAVDQVRAELAEIRGQVDELLYGVNILTQEADLRLSTLEQKAGLVSPPPLGSASGARGDGEVPFAPEVNRPAAEGGQPAPPLAEAAPKPAGRVSSAPPRPPVGMTLPGVLIAPRNEDVGRVSAKTAFSLAESDLERGHFNLAAAGFANFLEQYPESSLTPNATHQLAESYRGQGLPVRAVKVWEMLVKAFPRHKVTPKALLNLGDTYRTMDDFPAAEDALKRLVARFPTSEEARSAKVILSELR